LCSFLWPSSPPFWLSFVFLPVTILPSAEGQLCYNSLYLLEVVNTLWTTSFLRLDEQDNNILQVPHRPGDLLTGTQRHRWSLHQLWALLNSPPLPHTPCHVPLLQRAPVSNLTFLIP
jgi:hypothetical protein